jgi:hypothetical protein
MACENDFRDLEFCKKLVSRAILERNIEAIRNLLDRISSVFIFSTDEFRKGIVDLAYSGLTSWSFKEIVEIGKESVLGNVLVLSYTFKKIGVITSEKIAILAELLQLVHIEDPLTFEYIPIKGGLVLDLNETVVSFAKISTIEKAVEACELLFINGRLEKSKDTVLGMLVLYENSRRSEHKFKGRIVSSLLGKRIDVFLALLKKICKGIDDESQLAANYAMVYDLLLRAAVPVFFDLNHFKFEFDKFYNDNLYFARLLDKSGNEHLLMPFDEINSVEMQKIFDPETQGFVTPTARIGKIIVHDVYSFRKTGKVSEVTDEQLQITRQMSENEIGKRIRQILHDQNITSHSPAEKADIYLHKLFVNNEDDLRDAAIIIKGKGYPKITLSDIASNLVKAVDLPVQLVFLVYTGILLDEPREKFTNQCDRAKKMHCIIDVVDLTKLFLAYNEGQ